MPPILEKVEIDGQIGILAHFDADFQMTDREHAVMAKVVFPDGSHVWYEVNNPPPSKEDEAPEGGPVFDVRTR